MLLKPIRRSDIVRVGLCAVATLVVGCGGRAVDMGALHARQVQLQREVDGLRATLADVERTGALFAANDLVVSLEESFVRDLMAARLPVTVKAAPYTLRLERADVGFTGTSTVRLHGVVTRDGPVSLEAEASVLGSLTDVSVDTNTSTLRGVVTVDHIEIARVVGMEAFLSGATLDEVARMVREEAIGQLPPIEIPVRVQEELVIPALAEGPVRVEGARLPLSARVSRVFAGHRRLWIAIGLTVGEATRQ